MSTMKICSKCGKEYPATNEYFGWKYKAKRILRAECKRCMAEYAKQKHLINKDAITKQTKQYRLANKDAITERKKRYRQEHAEECNITTHRHKAKKRNLPRTLTVLQWEETKLHFDNRCCYCNRELPLTQDHFVPVTKGGWYVKNNIVAACNSCNSSKCSQDALGWYTKQTFYSKSRQAKIIKYLGYTKSVLQLSFA